MTRIAGKSALAALALVLSLLPVYAPPGGAASEPVIEADLEGRPIPAVDVGRHHCEDFDFPRIHCYPSAADLERAVALRLASPLPSGPEPLVTSTAAGYVRIYADIFFGGASAYLSVPYDELSVIGWNDRISSFQGQAGAGGTFFEHIYGGGFAYPFNAYQQVTYVGDAYNDRFSSVRPR